MATKQATKIGKPASRAAANKRAARPGALRADAQRNRDLIVHAAAELFAKRGLSVTLNEIAHYAGVGVGTVYRRFPDREALIEEVFEDRFEMVAALMRAAAAEPDAWRGLSGFVIGSLELQAKDRGLSDLLLGAPLAARQLRRKRTALVPIAANLVERAKVAGQVRADFDVSDLPVLILMIRTALDVTRDVAPEAWRRFAQIALQGIRSADAPVDRMSAAPIGAKRIDAVMEAWKPIA